MLIGIFAFSVFVILSSIAYLTVGITLLSSFVVLLGSILIAFAAQRSFPVSEKQPLTDKKIHVLAYLLPSSAILFDCIFLFALWNARTNAPLQTPWSLVPWWMFVCVAISFFCLVQTALRASVVSRIQWVAMSVHFFTIYGIALIAFPYGFGYDPLIHQTAEEYIKLHGVITPLQPLYIGQYGIVSALSFLTAIPIDIIDRFLVPILVVATLPFIIFFGLVRGYGCSVRRAHIAIVLFTLYPLTELTFTVPHNLTVILLLWWIFLAPIWQQHVFSKIILWCISLAAMAIHPLIGVPLVISTLALSLHTWKVVQRHRIALLFGVGACIGVALVTLFAIYRFMHGMTLFESRTLSSAFEKIKSILAFPRSVGMASLGSSIINYYEYFIKATFFVIGIVCSIVYSKKTHLHIPSSSLAIGLAIAAFGLSMYITLPGIVVNEQGEFAARLYRIIPAIFFPLLISFPLPMILKQILNNGIVRVLSISILSISAALSLYLMYPQVNEFKPRAGWNASADDFEAVRFIEDIEKGGEYVVASDQLFAAVGLRVLGFEKTFKNALSDKMHTYAISPIESLYPYSNYFLYGEVNEEIIHNLKKVIQDRPLYLVVHSYWYRQRGIEREVEGLGGSKILISPSITVYRL
ncbi:MAG: hypothetical protein AAB400_03200 [Patescibacteria group bacterium]